MQQLTGGSREALGLKLCEGVEEERGGGWTVARGGVRFGGRRGGRAPVDLQDSVRSEGGSFSLCARTRILDWAQMELFDSLGG